MRSLDGDGRAGGELPDALLGNKNSQNTGLILRLDVLRLDVAHEEAAGASSGVTLLTQDATLLRGVHDQRVGNVDELPGNAAGHQIARQNEEGDRQQRRGIHAGEQLLRQHQHGQIRHVQGDQCADGHAGVGHRYRLST